MTRRLIVKGAGGTHLAYFGRALVVLTTGLHQLIVPMEVTSVQRPLLSVGMSVSHGVQINFGDAC